MTKICRVCGYNNDRKPNTRSEKQHRFFWAVMTLCWNAYGEDEDRPFPNMERMRKWVTVRCGFYEEAIYPGLNLSEELIQGLKAFHPDTFFFERGGKLHMRKARSIAYPINNKNGMEPEDFGSLIDKALSLACNEIIPGLDRNDAIREIEIISGIKYTDIR